LAVTLPQVRLKGHTKGLAQDAPYSQEGLKPGTFVVPNRSNIIEPSLGGQSFVFHGGQKYI